MLRNFTCISCNAGKRKRTSSVINDASYSQKRPKRRQWNKYPVLGMQNAGKTSLLKLWIPNSGIQVIEPTKSIRSYKLKLRKTKRIYWRPKRKSHGFKFLFYDLSGSVNARLQWSQYCKNVSGIFFVIDCNNKTLLNDVKSELKWLVDNLQSPAIPVVLLANKQDLPNSLTVVELILILNLSGFKNPWQIIPTSAVTGQGKMEALESMKRMSEEYKKKLKRTQKKKPSSFQNVLTKELKDLSLEDCSSCDMDSSDNWSE